jgi:hypothetical protein
MNPVLVEITHLRTQNESLAFDVNAFTHDSDALDEALVESFPASDPVAVSITRLEVSH